MWKVLLMAEILHQLIGSLSHFLLGFHISPVVSQISARFDSLTSLVISGSQTQVPLATVNSSDEAVSFFFRWNGYPLIDVSLNSNLEHLPISPTSVWTPDFEVSWQIQGHQNGGTDGRDSSKSSCKSCKSFQLIRSRCGNNTSNAGYLRNYTNNWKISTFCHSFDLWEVFDQHVAFCPSPRTWQKTKTLRCPREGLVTTKDNDDLQRLVGCCNVGWDDLFMMIFHGEENTSKKLGRFCFGGSPSPENFIHANWIKWGQKRSKKWEFMKLSKDMIARKRIQMSFFSLPMT